MREFLRIVVDLDFEKQQSVDIFNNIMNKIDTNGDERASREEIDEFF